MWCCHRHTLTRHALSRRLGGAAYANTFANIRRDVVPENVEFAMGVVSVADGFGIALAGLTGLFIEGPLCAMNELCVY